MDKASILGDAIKYVKQLQERVQTLEEQATKKTVESAVLVKRSFIFVDDDESSSSDGNSNGQCDQSLPEIQARVCGKDVLIRIHCDKHGGREAAILTELEKHHLTVHTSSSLPFGNNTLDITVIAQVNYYVLNIYISRSCRTMCWWTYSSEVEIFSAKSCK